MVRELLAEDGVLWLNYGDSYATGAGSVGRCPGGGKQGENWRLRGKMTPPNRMPQPNLKPKDLVGMPWRIALTLQDDGWYLRSDVIWSKPNPMPESVTDRPTKSHEYIFLLSKSERYFYNAAAIAEPVTGGSHARGNGVNPKSRNAKVAGWADGPGSHSTVDHARSKKDDGRADQGLRDSTKFGRGKGWRNKQNESFSEAVTETVDTRNVRTVWTMPTEQTSFAHFATFPSELARRCILAGSPPMCCAKCGRAAPDQGEHYENTKEVRRVRKTTASKCKTENTVLRQDMRKQIDLEDTPHDAGICDQPERPQTTVLTEPSDGLSDRIRNGAPRRNGERAETNAAGDGSCPPSEWEKDGQQAGKSATSEQDGARPTTKTSNKADRVSPLWTPNPRVWSCSSCGCTERRPSVILDPFMGSGTVAEAALSLGRRYVGCEINPEYAAIFRKHRPQQTGMPI